ncbi:MULTISPECIES: FAD-binding oxidoreductase [unclassified Mesorhizobium]|uniref:NAD(P)/FAD-dependent oxidoreductase n=1 Tax=unclassified Mesorhizobium TaxID=325217 RepID=UPI00112E931C|nr:MULTISPECIES: FAD-binding oxidoreductase [unclassified Mesorhizobium]MBZ9979870.1 FAD-binding oxidoreductase [Mesorhizobium sp. BR-1-1-8]TPL38286.1 FAD-binding oxidoreductase [Mesorhizobium sp. B2-4-8]TPL69475.1 FAD-binding oxidoreductase [Mesorhizobium sp. B2-4-1]
MAYPDTYYARTMIDRKIRPPLRGEAHCDVAVVGGGLAGLTTALQLSRSGLRVAVLEAQVVGFGASGRNGGFVTPGFATGGDTIAARVGKEAARQLHRLSIEGVEFVRHTIEALDISAATPRDGLVSVLRYDDGDALKAYADQTARDHGYKLQYLRREDVRSVLKSARYYQGLRDPKAFHIHPLNYLRSVADEIERLGGSIHESSEVVQCDLSGPQKMLRTREGTLRATRVVLATGGYTGPVFTQLHRAFLPIATYVMVSEPAPRLIAQAVATTDAVGDNRRAGDYYRLVDGGNRLLWGGRITTRAASAYALARELRREMVGTYPQLADLKTELAWSGLMSYARHLMPQIGELQPGVWYCTAFGGHGLNTTAIAGKIVAEGILGVSDRYRQFAPFGLNWAGGAAGLAAAQLTYWKLQAQDWWRERHAATKDKVTA